MGKEHLIAGDNVLGQIAQRDLAQHIPLSCGVDLHIRSQFGAANAALGHIEVAPDALAAHAAQRYGIPVAGGNRHQLSGIVAQVLDGAAVYLQPIEEPNPIFAHKADGIATGGAVGGHAGHLVILRQQQGDGLPHPTLRQARHGTWHNLQIAILAGSDDAGSLDPGGGGSIGVGVLIVDGNPVVADINRVVAGAVGRHVKLFQ